MILCVIFLVVVGYSTGFYGTGLVMDTGHNYLIRTGQGNMWSALGRASFASLRILKRAPSPVSKLFLQLTKIAKDMFYRCLRLIWFDQFGQISQVRSIRAQLILFWTEYKYIRNVVFSTNTNTNIFDFFLQNTNTNIFGMQFLARIRIQIYSIFSFYRI